MAIRAWYLDGLNSSVWDNKKDRYVGALHLTPLLDFPDDFHLFILPIYQQEAFEKLIKIYPTLAIHYKQSKPSYNYRYPNEGPKLLTYILKVVA